MDLSHLREEYSKYELNETACSANPLDQFYRWYDQAKTAQIHEPNAMILATATMDAKPSARVVLLKEFNERGFVFYTNYNSRKGQNLRANPQASLLFFWKELERQIRIEGRVEKISESDSKKYFDSRPLASRMSAIASPQSEIITSKNNLENKIHNLQNQAEPIIKPEHWGGYLLIPEYFEFWQGRPSRLHDRIVYELISEQWNRYRIAP